MSIEIKMDTLEKLLDWLNEEISKPNPPRLSGRDITKIHIFKVRRDALREIKDKIIEIEDQESK